MKVSTHRITRQGIAGFTLVELLVVVAIMALLAALTLGVFSYANRAASKSRTTTTLAAIGSALDRYNADFGEFPGVANPGNLVTVNNRDYEAAGAATLYQALSGDGYTEIYLADTPPGTANPNSDGEIEQDEAPNVKMADMPQSIIRIMNGVYFLADGWAQPFQYMPRGEVATGGDPNTVNPTYDLWSYAQDENPDTNPPTREMKLDNPTITELWIKNW
jgi:prepilin-type N-terminal cleavage/methylation domain-containing protein